MSQELSAWPDLYFRNSANGGISRGVGDAVFDSLLFVASFVFIASLGFLASSEIGGTNSYAVLAASFFEGRLDVDGCFDVDCAVGPDGRRWVVFPPFPALVALPFVGFFGKGFSGFHLLGAVMGATTSLLWYRNFKTLGLPSNAATWMAAATILASPAIFTVMRADMIWFFSQTTAFLLVTAALFEALHKKRGLLIGLYIGMSFLSRQMTILLAPLMLVMILDPKRTTLRIDGEVIKKTVLIAIPIASAIAVYFAYNWARFGDIFEPGYRFIYETALNDNVDPVLRNRRNISDKLFSTDFVFFNFVYMFLQGFHFEFAGDTALTPVRMDRFGSSILAASPFVLIALLAPVRRVMVIGWMTIATMIAIMLFYHSNGFSQINVQRYALDWLPIVFLLIAKGLTPGRFEVARLLILYSIGLNLAAFSFTLFFQ
jgi:hypothetical protein